ncbi:MAG: DUF5895 domain-containing protein, partial [Rhizonema sp. NSF051]|nr:DUF5895 domain-containing protein [Rhizonema sp. NSF051]
MAKTNKQPAAQTQETTTIPETVVPQETTTIPEPAAQAQETAAIQEPQEKDEFCSTEFVDPDAKLPRIQALRGVSADTCGYFVGIEQMASAGWLDFNEEQIITYT